MSIETEKLSEMSVYEYESRVALELCSDFESIWRLVKVFYLVVLYICGAYSDCRFGEEVNKEWREVGRVLCDDDYKLPTM